MAKKIKISEEELNNLYITLNFTAKDIADKYECSISTVIRLLQKFKISKPENLRRLNIAKTINNKTEEEKLLKNNSISKSRKGKGLGIKPWNKGKHTGNAWSGKHHTEETKQKISQTKVNKTKDEKEKIEKKRLSSRIYGEPWNKGKHIGNWSAEKKSIILSKQYKTKKENNSFNTSKIEDKYYLFLIDKYGKEDVHRQYSTDSRYPFNCDFYIKSKDLFIELNLSWTHGGHPYNKDNEEDILKLNLWKEKAEVSEYYKNAIETWTSRDIKKHEAVKKNNLNYIEYYNESEIIFE